ncbi:MAG: ATPase domain-containing protein [Candidatus Margulisbacteria bacterium]|nr:ATPase domain-containing protein [Candidatus Margulisiibacteriota bacterium]
MTERTSTGISGLDALIEGGLPKGRNYFISGSAGSGKTILSSQFIFNGAFKFSEKGLYVSFEEPVEDILDDLSRFEWKKDIMLQDGIVKYMYLPMLKSDYEENVFNMLSLIVKEIKENKFTRLVLDSLTAIGLAYKDYNHLRKDIFFMLHEIKKMGCTTLIITEKPSGDIGLTRFGVEDFLGHGLIMMYISHTYRGLEIRKMRGTSHSTDIHRMRITDSGIIVYPGDHPY